MEHPLRSNDVEHTAHLHRLLQKVREAAAVIVAAIAEEIGFAALSTGEAEEAGFDEVTDIYEGDDLRRIAHSEIHMLADAVCHEDSA